jgi:signal transduction histidine kinase
VAVPKGGCYSESMKAMRLLLAKLSLIRLLLGGGAVILLAGMLVIGLWLSHEIENAVLRRAGLISSLYVDSFLSSHLQSLSTKGHLDEADRSALDRVLSRTELGQHIVAFKIWAPDGRILYSTTPALVGRQFPVKPSLASALAGEVHSERFPLVQPQNEEEHQRWSRLVEIFVPVRAMGSGKIIAAAEFSQTSDDLAQELGAARLRSWLMVGITTVVIFLLLGWLVRRANDTIVSQQGELGEKVSQLTALLTQNEQLHERVRRAAARTTALNERFLHRISADLHDGPGQALALALMRMETLSEQCSACRTAMGDADGVSDEFRTLHGALQSALTDLRAVSAGLHLPEIEQLTLADTARRAVRDYERNAGVAVALDVGRVPAEAPLPVKITLFRLLQESLANGFRHGGGVDQRVNLNVRDGQLLIEVSDAGKGFDTRTAETYGHLGLAGMRERVEILGGTFGVRSAPGGGTVIRAALPLAPLQAEEA